MFVLFCFIVIGSLEASEPIDGKKVMKEVFTVEILEQLYWEDFQCYTSIGFSLTALII